MLARLVIVPLDLRMSADAVEGIVRASGARHLVLGTGRDAPDPREAGLEHFPTTTVDALSRRARDRTIPLFPAGLGGPPGGLGPARPTTSCSSSSSRAARPARPRAWS